MGVLEKDYYPRYTYDNYVLWEGDSELIKGIPYAMSPAPTVKHQSISNKIARQLDEQLEKCEVCQALLPVDWKIAEDTVVQPDNLVVCYKAEGAYITKTPSLIFEILSKSSAQKDIHIKYELYEKGGGLYYAIIEPVDEIAKVYELNESRYIKW